CEWIIQRLCSVIIGKAQHACSKRLLDRCFPLLSSVSSFMQCITTCIYRQDSTVLQDIDIDFIACARFTQLAAQTECILQMLDNRFFNDTLHIGTLYKVDLWERPVTGNSASGPSMSDHGNAFVISNRSSNVSTLKSPMMILKRSAVRIIKFAFTIASSSPSKYTRPFSSVVSYPNVSISFATTFSRPMGVFASILKFIIYPPTYCFILRQPHYIK